MLQKASEWPNGIATASNAVFSYVGFECIDIILEHTIHVFKVKVKWYVVTSSTTRIASLVPNQLVSCSRREYCLDIGNQMESFESILSMTSGSEVKEKKFPVA